MAESYERLRYVRFYKDRVDVGKEGYNPKTILSYNSTDDLIQVTEIWRDEIWQQTISGSGAGGPLSQAIAYETIYDPWEKI